jgi:hypothetical protein
LLLKSKLALAETLLANGEARESLNVFLELQKSFVNSSNLSTRWQSFAVAAQASQILGEKAKANEYAAQANRYLSEIEKTFGAENYQTYLARRDVQIYLNQLGTISKL